MRMAMRLPGKIACLVFLVSAGCIAGTAGYFQFGQSGSIPYGLIQANGRFEGDTITVAAKLPGRIKALHVREGATVSVGDVFIELDDKAAQARYSQANAAYQVAQAKVNAVRASVAVLESEVPCQIAMAEAGVAAAKATIAKVDTSAKQARRDLERNKQLVEHGAVSRQAAEKSENDWQNAQNELKEARAALAKAEETLKDAQIGPERIEYKKMELATAEAAANEARARVDETQSDLDDLIIKSPADGRITNRFVNVGEVVNAGTPLYELVDLDNIYLKVFVPENEIGKLRLDLPAYLYTDAYPDRPFPAQLRYIASQAEFTPKEVQTQKERVKLVYAVKLYLIENPDQCLTPGLPADAVIRWKQDTAWVKPY